MQVSPTKSNKYIKKVLKDQNLKKALLNATQSTVESRQKIIDQTPYWQQLRQKCHDIKKDVLENLDKYLEQFEANCQINGIRVHWAQDAEEACRIILQLARENNVKTVVKSKSLTTEEIGLNKILKENNINSVETDLGEFIVQLMGQIPSHLIIPALHLTRQDIGKLFHEKLGCPYTDEPQELLKIARSKLRQLFLSADMGISGANFGIAESGCICVVENEANAHFVTSLPKIHVAVMGIEKIIPSLKTLPYFLKLLPPNATGQKISTYVNFIGSASGKKFGEGPQEVHIILLDNGRTKILQEPKLRQSLFCVRCGACLNCCPVYQQIGGHSYGWVYMGPIGITLIPLFLGFSEGRKSPYLCSLCQACYEVCSTNINLPAHILELRKRIVQQGFSGKIERMGLSLWAFFAAHPRLYKIASFMPAKLQYLLPAGLSFPAPGYFKHRCLPRFDSKGFRKRYLELTKNKKVFLSNENENE